MEQTRATSTRADRRAAWADCRAWEPVPDIPMCMTCKYFRQHYIVATPDHVYSQFRPLPDGHCCKFRGKHRMVYDLCEHYEKKEG